MATVQVSTVWAESGVRDWAGLLTMGISSPEVGLVFGWREEVGNGNTVSQAWDVKEHGVPLECQYIQSGEGGQDRCQRWIDVRLQRPMHN